MTRVFPIQDLPVATRELLAQITTNDEVIIEDAGQPIARITAVPHEEPRKSRPPLGIFQGQIWMAPDFDDELPLEFWCPPDDPLTT
ncbi:MAG TPA: type II toxin-antitoxin system prevent-host-death family antitoxin [Phycisphaerae bacterium]|nr:type II toxin-antitoxin system prevent-host-death family antitoxin [Phycisphaerae bacterium]